MQSARIHLVISILPMLLLSCDSQRGRGATKDAYTLYRTSPLDASMRIHVATFDSTEGYDVAVYNQENCEFARESFAERIDFAAAGVTYFCEKGLFRK